MTDMDDSCEETPRPRGHRRPRRWLHCPGCGRRLAQIVRHDGQDWLRVGGSLADLARLRCGRCKCVRIFGVADPGTGLLTAQNSSATLTPT